jgi:predicted protein tyrosine phosphatase
MMNRLHNVQNPYQGDAKKVLCVCSAGLLRSPTAAEVLSRDPYNYNTRAVGMSSDYALIVLDEVLLHWADEVVFMEEGLLEDALEKFDKDPGKLWLNLDIEDNYRYRDEDLIFYIKDAYDEILATYSK